MGEDSNVSVLGIPLFVFVALKYDDGLNGNQQQELQKTTLQTATTILLDQKKYKEDERCFIYPFDRDASWEFLRDWKQSGMKY